MKHILKFLLLTSLLIFYSINLNAACRKKLTAISPSGKSYYVEITFTSGYELNDRTNSDNYINSKGYATIFWGPGQATVIELTYSLVTFSPSLPRFDCTVLEMWKDALPGELMEGYDQKDNKWKICVSNCE